ncbi:MAG: hypothetical protein Q8Q12_21605 [bacterium]|nr:hypothetical protein [bacterium]
MKRLLFIAIALSIALPCFGVMQRRDESDNSLLNVDFTGEGIYIKRAAPGTTATFTRASSALEYWQQPARLAATNIPRFWPGQGILIEGADTNVCIRNEVSSFVDAEWTEVNLMVGRTALPNLYNGGSIFITYFGGDAYHYQTKLLTAVKYIVSALVYIDPAYGAISTQMKMAAGVAGAIAGLTTNYEHLGNDVYLCWAVFTATAANWDIGFKFTLPGFGYLAYHSCLTCHIAAPTLEGGDFPRSPIPNTTGASITRAADVLTIPGTGNIGTTEGTIDVELTESSSEAQVATANIHYYFGYYQSATNYIVLYIRGGSDTTAFAIRMGGAGACDNDAAAGQVRGNNLKLRLVYRQATTLDETNYAILYRNAGAGWGQLCVSAVQPTGPLNGTGTIYVEAWIDLVRHVNAVVRRITIWKDAKVGIPGG